jgi:HK97 family phage prohead protease
MDTRDFALKVKALEDSGSFSGFASSYGDPPDYVGDVIEPGAFKQAIAQQGRGYPLLWAHQQSEPVGIARISDSQSGLVVDGELLLDDPAAVRAHRHLKAGSIKGLSIGFTVPRGQGKSSYRDDGVRVLREVHLHEISLVAVPANPRATVTSVKTLGDVRHVLTSLRDGDVDDDELSELDAIDRELKRLLVAHDPAEKANAEALRELQGLAAALKGIRIAA